MKIYVGLDETRNVIAISTCNTLATPNQYNTEAIELLNKLEGFSIENENLVYSEELYEQKLKMKAEEEAIKTAESNIEYLKNKEFLDSLSDEDALSVAVLYPKWTVGIALKTGQRIMHEGTLYKVLKPGHMTQETWTPDVSPSLFTKVLVADENIVSEWEQPDSTNGYSKGNKVFHKGKIFESLVDNNVWEPGVEGTEALWKEVTE